MGARYLFCHAYRLELEIRFHYAPYNLNSDYRVFDCGSLVVTKDNLELAGSVEKISEGQPAKIGVARFGF